MMKIFLVNMGWQYWLKFRNAKYKIIFVATFMISICFALFFHLLRRITAKNYILADLSAFGPSVDLYSALSSDFVVTHLSETKFKGRFVFLSSDVVASKSIEAMLMKLVDCRLGQFFITSSSQSLSKCLLLFCLKVQNHLFLINRFDLSHARWRGPQFDELAETVVSAQQQVAGYRPRMIEPRAYLSRQLGIPISEEFVCLSIRTPKFKTLQGREQGLSRIEEIEMGQSFRNAEGSAYRPAVEYLVKEGLNVVLMADSAWAPDGIGLGEIDGLFLAPPEVFESYRLQKLLHISAIASVIGGIGGAANVPWSIGSPVAVADWIPLDGLLALRQQSTRDRNPFLNRNGDVPFPSALERTMVSPKRYVCARTSKIFSCSEAVRFKFYSDSALIRRDISVINSSPRDIEDLVRDLLVALATGWAQGNPIGLPHQEEWKKILLNSFPVRRVGQGGRNYALGPAGKHRNSPDDFYFASLSPSFALRHQEWLV